MVKKAFPLALLLLGACVGAGSFDEMRAHGWAWAYLGVFALGFGTSLTPCVFPMITITVGIFGAKQARSRLAAFGLASMYVLGMVVMFTGLGVVLALTGRATGAGFLLSKPAVVIPIVLLYVVLAASMFGAFDLNLPSSWQSRLSGVGGKGTAGAFLMGLVGGIIAAPCTGPILAGLLTFIATTRSVGLGFSLMLVYALGMGVLFLVVATTAVSLPKSGAWMDVVKALCGVALLVMGAYFLVPIWPALARFFEGPAIFRWVAIAVGVAGALLVVAQLRLSGPRAAAVKVIGVILLSAGAAGAVNWRPPPLRWRTDQDPALVEARARAKPVLIDFAADWCAPCKAFEANVLSDPRVRADLDAHFVAVRFDVSKGTERDLEIQTRWNAESLPTVLLLGRDGAEARRFQGTLPDADAFAKELRALATSRRN